jgi:hypothetical protein
VFFKQTWDDLKMKQIFATDYEIVRAMPVNGRHQIDMAQKPDRVGTLLDESKFVETGGAMVHNQTVFFEDYGHDWNWTNGKFSYYTRVAEESADIVVAYATEYREVITSPKSNLAPDI